MSNEVNNFLNILNSKYYPNYIQKRIKYFSTFLNSNPQNQISFNIYKYNPEIIKSFDENIITQFFMLSLNKFIETQKNASQNKDILFISMLIGKLYNENIINKNVVIKLSTCLLEHQKFEEFFEILSSTGVGELLNTIQEKNLNSQEKIEIRKILRENSKYVKNILLLDTNEYEPYKYISSLFLFKFNWNLLNADLLLNDFKYNNKNYLTKNYIINIFKLLLNLFEEEEKIQKNDLIRGLYIKDSFNYSNKITLVEKFNININLKVYHKQSDEYDEYNIFKLYKDNNNTLVKLYFDEKFNLKLKYYEQTFLIINGKNIDLNHMHSMKLYFIKQSGWLNSYSEKIKIILNGQEYNFESNSLIDGEECYVSFGEYNGELIEFSIMNNKKEIFKINFLSLYNLYKNNLIKKEYIIDHQRSKLIKITNKNINKNEVRKSKHKKTKSSTDLLKELNYSDYFFENKKTIIKFLDEYGLEYISNILVNITKTISNNNDTTNTNNDTVNYKDIYEALNIFWDLFQYLYNLLIVRLNDKNKKNSLLLNNNRYYFKKLITILYSYSLLQSSLSEKMKMPENLINKIVLFLIIF